MIYKSQSGWFFTLFTLFIILNGCGGGGGGGSKTPTLSSVTVSSAASTVPAGQTIQLSVAGVYSNSSTQDLTSRVTWSVSDDTLATVSSKGLVTSIKKGTIVLTATYSGLSDTLSIEITDPVLVSLDIIAPSNSIPTGPQVQLQTKGILSDGTINDLTDTVIYSLSNSDASISASGLLSNVTGNVTLTACSDSICEDLEITLSSATLNTITVETDSTETSVGLVHQFTATGNYSDGSTWDLTDSVTWTSSDDNIASPGTTIASQFSINNSTSFTATATYDDGSVVESGTSQLITVNAETLESITIVREAGNYPIGYFTAFTATGNFTGDVTLDLTNIVTWAVENGTSGDFPNSTGAPGFFVTSAEGTVDVTATFNSISASETITVTGVTFLGFDIKPDASSNYLPIFIDENSPPTDFTIFGIYSDSSSINLSSVCTWVTPVNNLLSITSDGEVSVLRPVASASGVENWGVIAVLGGVFGVVQPVSVIKEIDSISISVEHQGALTQNDQGITTHYDAEFYAEATYQDSSTGDITNYVLWNSDTPENVRFFDDYRYIAHGLNIGTSTISASLLVSGSPAISSANNIQITVHALNSLIVRPYNSSFEPATSIDETVGFFAFGQYAGNSEDIFKITNYVTWSSSNENYISIGNTPGSKGVITVNSTTEGSTTISAIVDDGSGSNNISGSFGPIVP